MFNLLKNRSKERHALVIGNGAYEGDGRLVFPKNDARAVAGSLEELGFQVTLCLDQDRRDLELNYLEFRDNLQNAKLALVYYSGHGCQIDGRNYLVPIDVGLSQTGQFEKIKPFDISHWANGLEERADRRIFILDACRNNPFLSSANSSYIRAKRIELSAPNLQEAQPSTGLSDMDIGEQAIIAFGAAFGRTAWEPIGNEYQFSFYTNRLIQRMSDYGLDIKDMFSDVAKEVSSDTKGNQIPWTSHSNFSHYSLSPKSYELVWQVGLLALILGGIAAGIRFDDQTGQPIRNDVNPWLYLNGLWGGVAVAYASWRWSGVLWKSFAAMIIYAIMSDLSIVGFYSYAPEMRAMNAIELSNCFVDPIKEQTDVTVKCLEGRSRLLAYIIGGTLAGLAFIVSSGVNSPFRRARRFLVGTGLGLGWAMFAIAIVFSTANLGGGEAIEWWKKIIASAIWHGIMGAYIGYVYSTYVLRTSGPVQT